MGPPSPFIVAGNGTLKESFQFVPYWSGGRLALEEGRMNHWRGQLHVPFQQKEEKRRLIIIIIIDMRGEQFCV